MPMRRKESYIAVSPAPRVVNASAVAAQQSEKRMNKENTGKQVEDTLASISRVKYKPAL